MRKFPGELIVAPLCLLSLHASLHAEPGCETPDTDFQFLSAEMRPSALPFVRQIPVAIQAVCEWWGPTYNGPFHIVVNNVLRQSMALVPAWYGKIGYVFFPDSVVYLNRGGVATIHEVTHVFAPNANRFLAEGLAVHAHEHLKGPPAYPNFGADIKCWPESMLIKQTLVLSIKLLRLRLSDSVPTSWKSERFMCWPVHLWVI